MQIIRIDLNTGERKMQETPSNVVHALETCNLLNKSAITYKFVYVLVGYDSPTWQRKMA